MAEWLGSGLQNRVRRFESARDLNKSSNTKVLEDYFFQPDLNLLKGGIGKIILQGRRPEGFVEWPLTNGS